MFIQALVAKWPVEAFNERVLCWLAGLNQFQFNAMLIGPLVECPASEPRSLVSADGLGITSESSRLIQYPCQIVSRDSEIHRQVDGLLGANPCAPV